MIDDHRSQTAMAREIREIPTTTERLLAERESIITVANRIRQADPRVVVISGRGSSGNAATFLRYLFEARAGLLVSTSAPSVMTTYGQSIDMRNAGAGLERSVAATKSVVLSMVTGAQLVALLTSDDELNEKIKRLPQRFSDALACDWSLWNNSLPAARAAFVVGRGFGLGSAREIGLKVTETMRLPTLGYSAAEVMHGPLACASAEIPFLVLRQNDGSSAMVDALIAELRVRKLNVFSAGDPTSELPWIGNDDPICDAITMLLPAYASIEQAARARGFDPDNPPNLSKITETM
jgi:glucosamine--fructose-6-phosphate aminotransferase (isomerizing)